MLLVSFLTALISVNGAVAALLPVVVVMAVRLKRMPSQLLMPLVFSAHAGSMLALTGTPVNVLVSNAASDAGVGRFGFFEFTLVGVPLLLGTMAIIILFGERLLPQRSGPSIPSDFSKHAQTLVEQYGLSDGMFQMRVRASSPFVGHAADTVDVCRLSPACSWSQSRQGDGGGPLRARDHRGGRLCHPARRGGQRQRRLRPTSIFRSGRRAPQPTCRKRCSTANPALRKSSYRRARA